MNRVKDVLNMYVGLKRLTADLEQVVRKDIARYELSVNEFAVLELLFHKGSQPVQQIKEKILVAASSTTYILDKLCKQGLVKRQINQTDKRITYIHLTESGKDLMSKAFPEHEHVLETYFSNLSDEEVTLFHQLIKTITDYPQ
ncbi:MarR family winged helix-turn-helix transcriptional regulator [Streptococcus fryi]